MCGNFQVIFRRFGLFSCFARMIKMHYLLEFRSRMVLKIEEPAFWCLKRSNQDNCIRNLITQALNCLSCKMVNKCVEFRSAISRGKILCQTNHSRCQKLDYTNCTVFINLYINAFTNNAAGFDYNSSLWYFWNWMNDCLRKKIMWAFAHSHGLFLTNTTSENWIFLFASAVSGFLLLPGFVCISFGECSLFMPLAPKRND